MGTFAADDLIDSLAIRLRDVDSFGYTRPQVLRVLNFSQRSINAYLGLVSGTATLTTSNVALYSVPDIATDIVRIIEIKDTERMLTKVPMTHLVHQDPAWYRLGGPQAEVFANIGRDLLAVIPIPALPADLTVVYVKQTDDLTDSGASLIEIPDEYKPLLLDLTESVLLFRGRMFANLKPVMERTIKAIGIERQMDMMRAGGSANNE